MTTCLDPSCTSCVRHLKLPEPTKILYVGPGLSPLRVVPGHEWAFIKTRWTPAGNGVKELRCMHCRCIKSVRYNGTAGGGEYRMPGAPMVKRVPQCKP